MKLSANKKCQVERIWLRHVCDILHAGPPLASHTVCKRNKLNFVKKLLHSLKVCASSTAQILVKIIQNVGKYVGPQF